MHIRALAVVLVLTGGPFLATAADEEHPYKKLKVGDYFTYKMMVKIGDKSMEGSLTKTVSAKSDKKIVLRQTGKLDGMDLPSEEQEVDLSKPFDVTGGAVPSGTKDAKVELVTDKHGKEKVKAAGKDYDCEWITLRVKGKQDGLDMTADVKMWLSKECSLWVVKQEIQMEAAGMKFEIQIDLAESGSKSD